MRIKKLQTADATRVKVTVAHNVLNWQKSVEEILKDFDTQGELHDVDEIQSYYFENGGILLGMFDGERLIGTGAIANLGNNECELKRLWFLPEYHGQKLGYSMLQELFSFARQQGYKRVKLTTDRQQTRALEFYKRIGFDFISSYRDDNDDTNMGMDL